MRGVLSISDFRKIGEVVVSMAEMPPVEITDPEVVIDSREITEGAIFIALKGERADGHCYIDTAFDHGASWAMAGREWYEAAGSPVPPSGKGIIVTDDTVGGLQQLAMMYRNTFPIPVVAIGGSNGKTTTKEMVASVLGTGFRVIMSRGNRNNHLGVPLTLLQIRKNTDIAVVEVGINHPDEMAVLAGIARPTHALLTNIGREHLEFLVDLDGVAAAETQLFAYLHQHGGTAFVNVDDERLRVFAEGLPDSISYGISEKDAQHCCVSDVSVGSDGRLSFLIRSGSGAERVTLNFTGRHNVTNAVAAASVGLHFGLSLLQVCEGLARLVPSKGWKRLEVSNAGGLRILNDTYNANSDSMRLAIDALCDIPCNGRRVAVLGDMLELGAAARSEHESIGRYLQHRPVDLLFTLGEQSSVIGKEVHAISHGHFENHETLLDSLLTMLRDGDTVLFKASRGMKLERIVDALVNARALELVRK